MNNILFLCVANSARSQMAEAIARRLLPPQTAIWSAGSQPSHVNPFAVKALALDGIDISTARSKGIGDIPLAEVETVITLCGEEVCPVFPGDVTRLHWPLRDPAAAEGDDEAKLEAFCAARDEIAQRIQNWLASSS